MDIRHAPPSSPASTCRLVMEGELDIASAVQARAATQRVLSPGLTIELDLSGVTFMDSAGARFLLWAGRTSQACSGRIVLAAMSHQARRLLVLAGAEEAVRSTCTWTLAS